MTLPRFLVLTALALAGVAPALPAQNSVYGVQGIGFPIRPLGVHARGLGGGTAAFDPASALNPATVGEFNTVTAMLSAASAFRHYSAYDSSVSGLLETRFPLSMVGARIGTTPLAIALSYGPYLERSFDFRTTAVEVLRGESVTVSDRVSSDGGMADFRGALAFRAKGSLRVGVAGHLITGSSKLRVRREFSNSSYVPFAQQSDLTFAGAGVSVGATGRLAPGLAVAGTLRTDTRLHTTQEGFPTTSADLPTTVTGGLRIEPVRGLAWATTAEWRSWSSSAADLGVGTSAFDTWDLASGLEIGGPEARTTRLPLRLGVRYATLPFSGRTAQAHSLTWAAGSGMLFVLGPQTAAAVDVAVERVTRAGAGADERLWQVSFGITVRP